MAERERITPYFYVGQGKILVSHRLADGSPEGYRELGNVSKVDIVVKEKILEHFASNTSKAPRDEVYRLNTTVDLSMTIEQVNQENVALFYDGDLANVVASTGHEKVMQVSPGLHYGLDHVDVEAVVITDMGGTTTYDESNCVVTPSTGSLLVLADQSGAANPIGKGHLIKVKYNYNDQKHVAPFTGTRESLMIRFEGVNTAADSKPVVVECFKASHGIVSQLALISKKAIQVEVGCALLEDPTRSDGAQYFREMAVQ